MNQSSPDSSLQMVLPALLRIQIQVLLRELRGGVLTLVEVAPGIDVREQVLAHCAPGVRVAEPLRTMDPRIFDPAPMLTRERG